MQEGPELGAQSHEDRASKRHRADVDEATVTAVQQSSQAMGDMRSSCAHDGTQMQHTGQTHSPVQAANDAEVRRSMSPRLTTKDGSPSAAAQIRSGATPSRVKVPMRPMTEPH